MIHVAAIIPAAGKDEFGRKGMLKCGGSTLLARTITSARRSTGVDRIVVASDEPQVRAHAKLYTAHSIKVPPGASLKKIILLSSRFLWNVGEYEPDIILILNWRTPLISYHDYSAMVELLTTKEGDSIVTILRDRTDSGIQLMAIPYTDPGDLESYREIFSYIEVNVARACWFADWARTKHLRNNRVLLYPVERSACLEVKTKFDLRDALKYLREHQEPLSIRQDFRDPSDLLSLPVDALKKLINTDGVWASDEYVAQQTQRALDICGSKKEAASYLGIQKHTLLHRIRRFRLK